MSSDRLNQVVLIVSVLVGSWLAMQVIHECGHVLGAFFTGGRVQHVVLYPLGFSRTEVMPNPDPLIETWAGPIIGVVVPLMIWAIGAAWGFSGTFVLRFFAGFCLVANGGYLAFGSLDRVGDVGVLIQCGTPVALLWVTGLAAMAAGFLLWNKQGRYFGLSPVGTRVDGQVSMWCAAGVMILFVIEMLFSD